MYEELVRDLQNWSKAWGEESNPIGLVPVKHLAEAAKVIHQLSHHADDWEKIADYWRKKYEEVMRYGRWIDLGNGDHKCSLCGRYHHAWDAPAYYCPKCGAKMDESEGE